MFFRERRSGFKNLSGAEHKKAEGTQKSSLIKLSPNHNGVEQPQAQSQCKKGKLILSTGLGGTGQTTHLREVAKIVPNCILIEKDILNEAFLGQHTMQSQYYKDHVKMQTYHAMIRLACSLMELGKIVIIDGGVGGKLTSFFKHYLDSNEFATKVIYFHCSGQTQYERIVKRDAARDADKLGEKFGPYRQEHISQQLRELVQISHISIDTDDTDNLQQNVECIVDYIHQPSCSSIFSPVDCSLPQLKINDAMKGLKEINLLLEVAKNLRFIVQQEAMHYLSTFANPDNSEHLLSFVKFLNKIKNKNAQCIWEKIYDRVSNRVFKKLNSFYLRKDDPDFVDFISTGRSTPLGDLSHFQALITSSSGYHQYCSQLLKQLLKRPGMFSRNFLQKTDGSACMSLESQNCSEPLLESPCQKTLKMGGSLLHR